MYIDDIQNKISNLCYKFKLIVINHYLNIFVNQEKIINMYYIYIYILLGNQKL